MTKDEIDTINSMLLIKLCRDIAQKQKEGKSKQCTLIINDALVQLRGL